MDFAAIFGDGPLTHEQFMEKIDGAKLVDLNGGEYVKREKFDSKVAKDSATIADLTKQLDELKAATDGDEGLKKQVESLTAKLAEANKAAEEATSRATRAERMELVSQRIANKKLARLALIDAEALVGDDTDFEDALEKVLADPEYTAAADAGKPAAKVDSGKPVGGKPEAESDVAAFRSGLGLAESKED